MLGFRSRNLKILRLRLRTRSGFYRRSNGQFRVGKIGEVGVKTTNKKGGVDKEQIETRLKNVFCVLSSISVTLCNHGARSPHQENLRER